MSQGAPIDGFGIGTKLDTSADAPYLDCAYKIQEYAGQARRKRSEGKASWPGRKQVYRRTGADGFYAEDLLTLESDTGEGEALVRPVMRGGKRLEPAEDLTAMRDRLADQLKGMAPGVRLLKDPSPYRVRVSDRLRELAEEVDRRPH
jgi:nicotinate phosphoribosyltransferase